MYHAPAREVAVGQQARARVPTDERPPPPEPRDGRGGRRPIRRRQTRRGNVSASVSNCLTHCEQHVLFPPPPNPNSLLISALAVTMETTVARREARSQTRRAGVIRGWMHDVLKNNNNEKAGKKTPMKLETKRPHSWTAFVERSRHLGTCIVPQCRCKERLSTSCQSNDVPVITEYLRRN